jgi:Flp pilus assembly protein TadG
MATMTKNKSSRVARVWARRATCERGDTLVEFALGLTLFLAIVFGTIEIGLAVWQNNMLSNLAQEGARRASVCGSRSGLLSADCVIPDFVRSRSLGITVYPTVTPTDVSTLKSGDIVTVQVETRFRPLTTLFPHAAEWRMSSTAQMVVSR